MRPVFATISIDAPRERVFGLLCDLALRPAFTDHFQADYRLGRVDSAGPGAAARFRLHGDGPWMDTAIELVERPHLIRESGYGGRSNRVQAFTVWELSDGPSPKSCEVSLTHWTEARNPFDRARELFGSTRPRRRDWSRALDRLKRLLESDASVERVAVGGGDRLPSLTG